MRIFLAALVFSMVMVFSCTDRDDNLEGVQIRVQNTTVTTFSEVVIDSLIFPDMKPDEIAFYQKYEGATLPQNVVLTGDSLSMTVSVDSIFEIDSTKLNLFTYRIKGLSEESAAEVQVLKD